MSDYPPKPNVCRSCFYNVFDLVVDDADTEAWECRDCGVRHYGVDEGLLE